MNDVEIRFTGDPSDGQQAALAIDAALEQIQRLAEQVSRALGEIKIGPGQTASVVAQARSMEAALSALERQARDTKREMHQVGSFTPQSLLAAAVTGGVVGRERRTFAGGGPGASLVPYNPTNPLLQNRVFAQDAQYAAAFRRSVGVLGGHDDGYNVRYGAGMGGRISGPLESFSDRGRGGLLGALFGAGGGRGGGGSEVMHALGGGGGGGGGGGRGGVRNDLSRLSSIVPGGGRATGAAFATGVGLAGTALADLGPGLLAPLALLPSLATGAVGSLGVLMAALHGTGAAIAGDAKAFSELNPQAQQFVTHVRSMIPWVEKLQGIAQKRVLPGLTAGMNAALTPAGAGAIEKATGAFGGAVGGAAAQAGAWFGSGGGAQQFEQLAVRSAGDVKKWADTALHLVDALLRLANAFAPLTEWMLKGIDAGARWFDAWVRGKQATDGFAHSIETAKSSLHDIGALVGSLIRLIDSLAAALQPVGHVLLIQLAGALNGISDWINQHRTDIQNVLIGALLALGDAVKTVLAVLGLLLTALQILLTPLSALVGNVNAVRIAFAGLIALQIANAFSNMASQTSLFGKALLGLRNNPAIWAVIVALGAVAAFKGLKGNDPGGNANIPAGTTDTADITGKRKQRAEEVIALRKKGWTDRQIQAYLMGDSTAIKGLPQFGKAASGDIFMGSAFTDANALTVGQGKRGGVMPATTEAGNAASTLLQGPHHTEGFPGTGRTAVDIAARVGAPVLAPEDGAITRDSGHAPATSGTANINGYSLYYQGVSGTLYFMTHMSWVAKKGQYKKGDKIGVIADHTQGGAHLHIDYAAPVSMANAKSSVAGTPPPMDVTNKASALPIGMQTSLAGAQNAFLAAQGTPGMADDRSAGAHYLAQVRAAEAYLRAHLSSLKGNDLLLATQELGSLISIANGITTALGTAAKKGRASLGSRLSAGAAGKSVLGLIGQALGPASALGGNLNLGEPSDILTHAPLADAHTALDGTLRAQRQKIQEFEKELRNKLISTDAVSTIRNRIGQIRSAVTSELGKLKDAAQQQAADFKSVWQSYTQTFDDAFKTQTSDILANPQKYPGLLPISAMLADLEDQHTTDQLNKALKDAQDNLAKALTSTDDSLTLENARKQLGQDALAHAIDVAQSYVLGGTPADMTDKILKDMQTALQAATANPDSQAVKDAKQGVADAEYEIKVRGLSKQATAEQTAFQDSRTELQKHLDASLALWGTYYAKSGRSASEALGALNALLVKFGFQPIDNPFTPGTGPFATPPGAAGTAGTSGMFGAKGFFALNPVGMADGGLITKPHYLVDTGGVVRGMVGERGTEAVVPVGSGHALTSHTPIEVHIHTKDDALAEFIDVRVKHPGNVATISRAGGRSADRRRRSLRY